MDAVQLCEIAMLVLFGLSWPFNIAKSWRSRTAKGKSVVFEYFVVIGYLIGLLGKLITFSRTGVLPYSTWFYVADILMVLTDMVLYYRNSALDRKRDAVSSRPSIATRGKRATILACQASGEI